MHQSELRRAIAAARLFISRGEEWNKVPETWLDGRQLSGTKLSGQVRRASLELTRMLADLRRGWDETTR